MPLGYHCGSCETTSDDRSDWILSKDDVRCRRCGSNDIRPEDIEVGVDLKNKNPEMRCLPVEEYNRKARQVYEEAKQQRRPTDPLPYPGFFMFYTNKGEERKSGYIAFGNNKACWGKTCQEALYTCKR